MPEPYENSKDKEGLNELTPSEEITSVPYEPPFPHALINQRNQTTLLKFMKSLSK